jgi:hypothetical protein
MDHPEKITFGEMRSSGVRGVLIYCGDYHCSHSIAISADRWPDRIRFVFGCPISSRVSSVRRAVIAAPTCGRIGRRALNKAQFNPKQARDRARQT